MKDEAFKNAQDPSKKEKKSQEELEKRIFHLKTLYDLSQEIGFLRETHEITKNLLLMMIGNFGASSGLIFLFDMSRGEMEACCQRGLPKESVDIFSEGIASGDLKWLNEMTQIEAFFESHPAEIKGKEKLTNFLSSFGLRIWVPFNVDSNLRGGIGLGDKLSGDSYSSDDQELLVTMTHQGAVAVENAKLQQARIVALEQSKKEIEKLSKAKSRALDHLSHELRTPLSVVQGNIRILKRRIQAQPSPLVRAEVFESLEKNLSRLSDIQQETDQIIRSYQTLETKQRLAEPDDSQSFSLESIDLYPFVEQTLENVRKQARGREIQFHLEGDKDLEVAIAQKVLEDILVGLLKNAIENTPDEGMIRVILEQKKQWIQIKVMDFGIGITRENQRRLFDGLFHTLDTELYASKRPYDFGAGGKGLDLLRAKVYGQRFKFDVSLASQRCTRIPTDQDLCPGRISACPHCGKPEDCLSSGGSTFCIGFPVRPNNDAEQFEP